ncbi:acetyltransferase [Streptomyces agglomeratus]|uniref:Acetyltransferase n=1 Tax=Streptomyces agglomeratus TaxID=285458 RepID=A0A1E5PGE2_9ACTN|nr:arylamine N-acetyltransferase [Streptomyces agglomeratus]OEJ28620.1 acetyltransferase [Streptomyces agglomeratus]OEJ37314.1 acetyltransferase [Streptomyces agglomeratus]OEJ48304.1 acetyltransferase [Streptomyces agglomeratus]OEJ49859.1 acetyltransferase [Streptomyces agglomeratus]OEJ57170.1 acetyltransferase [Streptomyces agglomeratus]
MDTTQVDSYLGRIGAARPERPTLEALRELHLRHLHSVPFENVSIHLGEDIVLEEKALFDKIVASRRGGFCYEANGVFASLLTALGFDVQLLEARVLGAGQPGIPYDHLALRVTTADSTASWLVDVGFGDHSHYPLDLTVRGDQAEPGGVFRIAEAPYGDLDVFRNGDPAFRLNLRPRVLADFRAGCWWHSTSPQSKFTRSLVCSRLTSEGRITLTGRKLVTTVSGSRHERELTTEAEVLAAYREHFDIALDRTPEPPLS